jgi:cadmium resistance protein CadD (predicted permease)
MDMLSRLSDVFGILGAIISLLIWLRLKSKEKFNDQRIKIKLKMPDVLVELPYEIERKYLTRSELQGLLGILPIKPGDGRKVTDRYELSFLNTPDFFASLEAAQDDKDTNTVIVTCYDYEVAQFDLDKIRVQCQVTNIA